MVWWAALLISAAFSIVGQLLAPKPEAPKPDDAPGLPEIDEINPVPVIWGTCMIRNPQITWWGDYAVKAIKKKVFTGLWFKSIITGYKYHMGMMLSLGYGSYNNQPFNTLDLDAALKITEIQIGEKSAWTGTAGQAATITIDSPQFFGGNENGGNGGVKLQFDVRTGHVDNQTVNSYLDGQLDLVPAWKRLAYLTSKGPSAGFGYYGNSSGIEPIAVKAMRRPDTLVPESGSGTNEWYKIGSTDANPVSCLFELLVNQEWGDGINADEIDLFSFRTAEQTVFNEGNGFSYRWDQQTSVEEMAAIILRQIDGSLYYDFALGKIVLKLARADYNPADLPTYGNDHFIEIKNLTRGAWDDTLNEVRVTYTDHSKNFKNVSVFDQDLSNFQIQGGYVSTNINYPGVSNETNARKLARRDMQVLTLPLLRFTATIDRTANTLKPGGVFKFSWPEQGITSVVMRVSKIGLGTLQDGTIELDCVEDRFSAATAVFNNAATQWTAPSTAPAAVANGGLDHLPYHYARDDKSRPYAFAAQPNGAQLSYQWVLEGAVIDSECDFTPTGTLSAAYAETPTDLDTTGITINNFVGDTTPFVNNASDAQLAEGVNLFRIDDEWLAFKVWSLTGTTLTLDDIWRGLLDSVPAAHSSGARAWFVGAHIQLTEQSYPAGTEMNAEFLTQSVSGILDSASAPDYTLTLNNRPVLPYVPGNIGITDTSVGSSLFSDNFNDNSIDTAKWTASTFFGSQGTSYAETNNRVEFTPTASTTGYAQFKSTNAAWDFRSKEAKINVVQHFSEAGGNCDTFFSVTKDANNLFYMGTGGGALLMRVRSGGTNSDSSDGTSGYLGPWYRIRHDEAATTVYFETSADGTNWTIRRTVTGLSWSPSSCSIEFGAGYWGTGNSSTQKAIFDDFSSTVGTAASGQVAISWARRNRLTQTTIIRQSTGDATPETDQKAKIKIYNDISSTLLRTYDDLTGTSQNYSATQEETDNGGTLATRLRIEIEAKRNSDFSYQKQIRKVQR